MSTLNIPVEVAEPQTGLAQAVLSEVSESLPRLASSGMTHIIDLTSLPMNDSDKRELASVLGKGEVSISLTTIGQSDIYETAYSGVWWIKHYGADQILISELIEVTEVPEIIKCHPDDIRKSASDIKTQLLQSETGE